MISSAKLYGLVLSGGKSTRMGNDKGLIVYHGIPQREYLYNLLGAYCERTFMSVRSEQVKDIPAEIETIVDEDVFRGPYNGLLSAHNAYPNVAWLVLACDLPLMDGRALQELINARDVEKKATAFALKGNPLPEPLCAIWEPRALAESLFYLQSEKGTCPRKYLINSDVKLVFPTNENVLLNANSQAEYETAKSKLGVT